MDKIINGKRYNTEAAREVARWENGLKGIDYSLQVLYCKRTGEYFLYSQGGEKPSDLAYTARLTPLTYREAKKWGETHMDGADYEDEFEVVEDGTRVIIHATISSATRSRLDAIRSENGWTLAEAIEHAVEAYSGGRK